MHNDLSFPFIYLQVDASTSKTNQVKQSGEVKVKQLAAKYEEIVKQVRSHFHFCHLSLMLHQMKSLELHCEYSAR